ncbi:hypothetical protein GTQ40_08445 [Flavobacteriaceae bacterium R38]|nr:hypothetical protein [Flavobacteriaceae bacterium R38]
MSLKKILLLIGSFLLFIQCNTSKKEPVASTETAIIVEEYNNLITTDLDNYWNAYDMYIKDTANAYSIFKTHYFDKATSGLKAYFQKKIGSIEAFIEGQKRRAKLYKAIKANTYSIDAQKKRIVQSMKAFKKMYPDLTFPSVYFMIGNFTSAGTISEEGLLIGIDQIAKSDHVPVNELSFGQKNNFKNIDELPHIVIHELVHFQQKIDTNETRLLYPAIGEGMADFLAELFSGKHSNRHLESFTQGREREIWEKFKKEMLQTQTIRNWLANASTATEEWPADLGYWVGYRICKAYYEEQEDKKEAIRYMLNLPGADIEKFLAESKFEQKIDQ